jgi:hypothetical protein
MEERFEIIKKVIVGSVWGMGLGTAGYCLYQILRCIIV